MLLKVRPEKIRTAGLSRAKTVALLDLATKVHNKDLPSIPEIRQLTDQQVIDALTQVKGIGPWSAEMFMIFTLGREDVLSTSDLGLRKGFALLKGLEDLPDPQTFTKGAEKWRPFRSVASWYLWRALEL